MFGLIWLIPAIPLASFAILATLGSRLPARAVAALGVGSIAGSTAIAIAVASQFLQMQTPVTQVLWTWIHVDGFRPEIAFYLDALSVLMTVVITFVSLLIHIYSVEFMRGLEGYSRFFAYMNLFVASMVTLVLANNLLLLYLGWEGVGLCSFLLIGFWYQDPNNGAAARKAFIVTRVGDTAMALGLFLIFSSLGTLDIQEAMRRAGGQWSVGSGIAIAASALLLGGAVGKSAQLPLQTWLPDAMAGPTPTSALIHAATMVTAGVYLIARTHMLFLLAPPIQSAVAILGTATMLMAGFSAMTQSDIKRVLAYSTMSQIGYMFLALGVGAWSAAIFHFMTHAFFKALLFLAAGVVIEALHHEHNIHRMGGLRRALPIAYWPFLIGGSALAGLPLITAGFYSKDLILAQTLNASARLWTVGILGVLLTSFYTYRLIALVFFGDMRTPVTRTFGAAIRIPILVLALLSIVGGFANVPDFLRTALPVASESHTAEVASGMAAAIAFAVGLCFAYLFFIRRPDVAQAIARNPAANALGRLWHAGWGFDWLYDRVFVRPVVWLADAGKRDFIDSISSGLADLSAAANRALSDTQTGQLRWYAAGIAAGSLVFVAIALFL
ncbi:MAG: NADH-quinone oxidoreductase subunit L [Bryobacteraceae bacterium]